MLHSDTEGLARSIARELARELRDNPPPPVEYLTPPEAATFCRLTTRALEQMRIDRRGPSFIKLGRLVRYSVADLQAWIESGRAES